MNEWLLAFVILWIGTGTMVTAVEVAKAMNKGRNR